MDKGIIFFCLDTKSLPTFLPQKSSKKLGAGFKGRRSTPEN